MELLGELGPARERLVAAREAELWCATYPSEDARTLPQFSQLAGGDKHTTQRVGLTMVTPIERLLEALRSDADWLTTATTAQQREVIDGEPQARPATATWAGSPEDIEQQRVEKREELEA